MASRPNILFLCSANSCRSQMAEALLRKHAGDRFCVHSAGLEPGEIHPLARTAMEEIGLDLSGQYSKGLDVYLGSLAVHRLIIVCDRAARSCPSVWPGVLERYVWPFEDPARAEGSEEEKLAKFREVRDAIDRKIQEWLAEGVATDA